MRIAVLEAVAAGLCGPDPEPSLLREGLAMWRGLVEDLAALPSTTVVTLLGSPWREHQPTSSAIDVRLVDLTGDDSANAVEACWQTLLEESDQALIIAPEIGGLLSRLVATCPSSMRLWNCRPATVDLCTDKLQLADWLTARGLRTIPTIQEDWTTPPGKKEFPCVVKPRDGAGSHLVRRIDGIQDWTAVRDEYRAQSSPPALRQPSIRGKNCSIAGWFGETIVDWLPIAEQRLSDDGRFTYLGGEIPAKLTPDEAHAVQSLANEVARQMSGLRGYVGFDVLMDTEGQAVLVEINPRLTSSYNGYRRLWSSSPWGRWLGNGSPSNEVSFAGSVRFQADGTLC